MQTETRVSMPLESVVLKQAGGISDMEHPENCEDCRRWAQAYESATMAFFRLQSQFQIASFGGDSKRLRELAAEIDRAWTHRLNVQEAARNRRVFPRCSSCGQK
jgi:hypothetical protein